MRELTAVILNSRSVMPQVHFPELAASYERIEELERLVRQARAIMTSGDLREDLDQWLADADEALDIGVRG